MLSAIPSIQPIRNDDLTRIASGYGIKTTLLTNQEKCTLVWIFQHLEIPCICSKYELLYADSRAIGYGKHIRIDHGYGYLTLYAHLNSYNVRRGQKVKKGDVIGFVGNTGRSKGVHLHYEVHKDGKKVNPVNYFYSDLTPEEFDEILKISSQENQSLD